MNYLVLELHKQPWYSNKIVGFNRYHTMSILEWKPAQKDTLENRIKKYINKSLTRIFRANNDDIGICKIWRNDGKSPV